MESFNSHSAQHWVLRLGLGFDGACKPDSRVPDIIGRRLVEMFSEVGTEERHV